MSEVPDSHFLLYEAEAKGGDFDAAARQLPLKPKTKNSKHP